jgi:lincosamide nucleotidyltransferase
MTPMEDSPVVARFADACAADPRVIAAFVSGSRAAGTADAHSDLDLCLIAREPDRDGLWLERAAFIRQLGEPLLLEDFDTGRTAFWVLADGTEGELTFGSEDTAPEIHRGPYRALVDKTGMLSKVAFVGSRPDDEDQRELLRRQIQWFWHDLGHFIAAYARGKPWWAAGQVQQLREMCVILARLRADFGADADGYDKLDDAMPRADLAPLAATFPPLELEPMLAAVRRMVTFYQQTVPGLAAAHGLIYPHALENRLLERLDSLG